MKKRKNNNENIKEDLGNTKEIIDLTKFMYPEMVSYDENGSYTGMPNETYYDGILSEPVQDADDL